MDEQELRSVLAVSDVAWILAEHESERAKQILREMHEVDVVFQKTFGRPLDPPLADAIRADTTRFKPLIQTFASPMTAPIRTMVYCVLDSAQIKAIRFEYRFMASAHFEVELEYDETLATFVSDDLWDADALRHFGLMKMGQAPVIDGYYAFRKRE